MAMLENINKLQDAIVKVLKKSKTSPCEDYMVLKGIAIQIRKILVKEGDGPIADMIDAKAEAYGSTKEIDLSNLKPAPPVFKNLFKGKN